MLTLPEFPPDSFFPLKIALALECTIVSSHAAVALTLNPFSVLQRRHIAHSLEQMSQLTHTIILRTCQYPVSTHNLLYFVQHDNHAMGPFVKVCILCRGQLLQVCTYCIVCFLVEYEYQQQLIAYVFCVCPCDENNFNLQVSFTTIHSHANVTLLFQT